MWFVLFNTEHFELVRRSSNNTTIPNLTQTSLMSVIHMKSNLTCSHTVQSLITERREEQGGSFSVIHYLPITSTNDPNEIIMLMVVAMQERQIRQSSSTVATTTTAASVVPSAPSTQTSSGTNGRMMIKNVISSMHAKHLAICIMYSIQGFMNLIIGELSYDQVHSDSQKYSLRRRLNVV